MKKELTALKPLFILLPLLVLGFLLFWTLFGGTLSKDFQFKSAPSEQFTQEEIQDAAVLCSAVSSTVFPAAR